MRFAYTLENCEHLPKKYLDEAEDALAKQAYVCQQEFEKFLDMYHEINLFDKSDTSGEARVTNVTIENDIVFVVLDCSGVEYFDL